MSKTTLREDQKLEILELFKEPRTIQEAADLVGINYFTLHRKMRVLRDEGVLREMPWPRGGSKVFCVGKPRIDGAVQVISPRSGKALTLPELVHYLDTELPKLASVAAGAMSQLYMRSYGLVSGEPHRRGSTTSVQVRQTMRNVRDNLSALSAMCEQLLLMNIWEDDNEDLVDAWGQVENIPGGLASMVQRAIAFESRSNAPTGGVDVSDSGDERFE